MQGVYTVEEIRAAETVRMKELPEGALMQRAATALATVCAQQLRERADGLYGRHVGLLVGTGNNGADALYAGAALATRGVAVRAVLLDEQRTHRAGLRAFRRAGGRTLTVEQGYTQLRTFDLIVDGIAGIGGHGALSFVAAGLVEAAQNVPVVAVDVPSGVDSDTGMVAGPAVKAAVTVTFGGLKTGLLVGDGVNHSGEVRLVDIGLDLPVAGANVLEESDVASILRVPGPADDKYTRGVVGVIAGSTQYPGAGVLATGAARHGGAGMIRYLGLAPAEVQRRYPDVVLHADADPRDTHVQAWVIGPGLGTDDAALRLLRQTLATNVPVLVDADAISLLAKEMLLDKSILTNRTAPTVLTPHDREFERLAGPVGPDRLGSARRAARELNSTVLLKGNATVVADPSGFAFINPTGTPWLGTAGSGDVLSGLIGSMMAAGGDLDAAQFDVTQLVAAGAYVHGVAGQWSARLGNPDAADVLFSLPRAITTIRG